MVLARPRPSCVPLESGDRLDRQEFERRYSARPDIKKAELIEGVVFVGSPVRLAEHAEPHADIMFWLGYYRRKHPGLRIADNGTLRIDEENVLQPDAMLFRTGGGATVDSDGYVSGAPELIVEIAASSASHDLGAKMALYERVGVQEYVVWQILEERIDWFRLEDGRFQRQRAEAGEVYASTTFPGLRLDAGAMIRGDLDAAIAPIDA